jgi:hypothetical protein
VRYIFITPEGVIDTHTGEVHDKLSIDTLLSTRPGGVIAGRNMYPILCSLISDIRKDWGWTASIHVQHQPAGQDRVHGVIYYSHLTHRFRKVRVSGVRFRPGSIKWVVLNLELFCEDADIESASRSLVSLAESRGVSLRYSPGTMGSAMIRASPKWTRDRRPAPRFISEIAREHLPGNLYSLRDDFSTSEGAIYIDQKSSHHNVASSIDLPHPHYLHARGRIRAVEKGMCPKWMSSMRLLSKHTGLIACKVICRTIPNNLKHLYPPWAHEPGERDVWIWTPELRLLDERVRLLWVSAGLTSYVPDPVLSEYSKWAISQLSKPHHSAIKPALLAAYGMLAIRSKKTVVKYTVHGRPKPPRSDAVSLPLIDGDVYRAIIQRRRTPSIQNVICRGVIEAEVRTRSLEMARHLESEGLPVLQIYADGLIVETDQVPILPNQWRVAASLTEVSRENPSSIISRELVRLPGIPNGRRATYIAARSEQV